jgi:hypothetical protein
VGGNSANALNDAVDNGKGQWGGGGVVVGGVNSGNNNSRLSGGGSGSAPSNNRLDSKDGDAEVADGSSSEKSSKKKGWGPPVAPRSELPIARGVTNVADAATAMSGADRNTSNRDHASRMFQNENGSSPGMGGGGLVKPLPKAVNSAAVSSPITPPMNMKSQQYHADSSANDYANEDTISDVMPLDEDIMGSPGPRATEEANEVMRRIENRRQSQIDERKEASAVFKRLRDKEIERRAKKPEMYKHLGKREDL